MTLYHVIRFTPNTRGTRIVVIADGTKAVGTIHRTRKGLVFRPATEPLNTQLMSHVTEYMEERQSA